MALISCTERKTQWMRNKNGHGLSCLECDVVVDASEWRLPLRQFQNNTIPLTPQRCRGRSLSLDTYLTSYATFVISNEHRVLYHVNGAVDYTTLRSSETVKVGFRKMSDGYNICGYRICDVRLANGVMCNSILAQRNVFYFWLRDLFLACSTFFIHAMWTWKFQHNDIKYCNKIKHIWGFLCSFWLGVVMFLQAELFCLEGCIADIIPQDNGIVVANGLLQNTIRNLLHFSWWLL